MFRIIKGVLFFVAFIFLFGFISMSLWNALVPELFHGPILTYWQTIGLLVLSKIFFGGFRGHHNNHHRKPRHWMGEWDKDWNTYKSWQCWGKDWEEKYKNMSAEDRERWKHEDMRTMWRSAKDKMDRDTDEKNPV
ncbi:MAG: hypothetical protein WCH46_08430 [bacterium]